MFVDLVSWWCFGCCPCMVGTALPYAAVYRFVVPSWPESYFFTTAPGFAVFVTMQPTMSVSREVVRVSRFPSLVNVPYVTFRIKDVP